MPRRNNNKTKQTTHTSSQNTNTSSNIWKFIVGAVALGGFYIWNKDTTTLNTGKIIDITNNKNSFTGDHSDAICKTLIVYERHDDYAPTKVVNTILESLREHNYSTVCFEEPTGMTPKQNLDTLSKQVSFLKQGALSIPRSTKDALIKSWEATMDLLYNIKTQGLTYVAVDMDTYSRSKLESNPSPDNLKLRDQFMANSINAACQEYKANQVLIVGAMHGGIEERLKELGHEVMSMYIVSQPPILDPSLNAIGRADNDFMLRTSNIEYMKRHGYEDMHVVDFYTNPDQAYTNLSGVIEEL